MSLSEAERDWLAGSFYLVGLVTAAADGTTSREEVERLRHWVADTGRRTKSFAVAQAAMRFIGEQRVTDFFFSPTRWSPEEAARRYADAVAGTRLVIAKLPEDDLHRLGAALLGAVASVMNEKGSTEADWLRAARPADAVLDALGIDVGADLAWVKQHGS